MGAIGWLTGGSTLFAATKGMCVVLHGRHRRHVRPWELWRDGECKDKDSEGKCSVESTDVNMMDKRNSYEDEVSFGSRVIIVWETRMLTVSIALG
jgi:hypothetical protein